MSQLRLLGIKSILLCTLYECVVRPMLEYACPIWHPHTTQNINALESVQCRAACWMSSNKWNAISYCWSKPSDDCIQELHWPTIHQRHNYYFICHVHDSLHHRNSLSFHEHYQLCGTSTRSHSLSIHPITSTINSYCFSFFVNSPFLWNSIPYTILQLKKSTVFCLLPFLIFFCLCCIIFVMLYLCNLYVLMCRGVRLQLQACPILLYNPVTELYQFSASCHVCGRHFNIQNF